MLAQCNKKIQLIAVHIAKSKKARSSLRHRDSTANTRVYSLGPSGSERRMKLNNLTVTPLA